MRTKGSRARLHTVIEADRRRIAQGERPVYTVLWATGPYAVDVTVLELPIVHILVPDDQRVLDVARFLIARTLVVDPQSFDVIAAPPN
jgi:hypothetical protein